MPVRKVAVIYLMVCVLVVGVGVGVMTTSQPGLTTGFVFTFLASLVLALPWSAFVLIAGPESDLGAFLILWALMGLNALLLGLFAGNRSR